MTVSDLLLPVFVQVGLTFFIMFWMGAAAARGAELRRGEAERHRTAPAKLAPA